jgi:hypothetical protein
VSRFVLGGSDSSTGLTQWLVVELTPAILSRSCFGRVVWEFSRDDGPVLLPHLSAQEPQGRLACRRGAVLDEKERRWDGGGRRSGACSSNVLFERVREAREGAPRPCLHGAEWDVESGSDFALRESAPVGELDQFTLVAGEVFECTVHAP